MNVIKLPNGKYKHEQKYKCPISGKWRKVSVTMSSNSTQAFNKASRILEQKIKERSIPTSERLILLDVVAREFMEQKSLRVKSTTLAYNKAMLKRFFEWLPDYTYISDLNAKTLQNYINNIVRLSSFSYARASFSLIRQLLNFARRSGYVDNIAYIDDIELKAPPLTPQDLEKRNDKFLDKHELKDVLQQLSKINPIVSMILEFQSLTGLRIGELIALRFEDVEGDFININGTYNAFGERTTPKNVYSVRRVLLNKRAIEIINYFISKAKLLYMVTPPSGANYIFVTQGGKPFDYHYINKELKKLNYSKHISTHTFRHTHISMLASAGVPLKAIMERVGHNEPQTTLAVYTHVTKNMNDQVAKALESF